ncbi:MAG: hypothetical protein ATN35_02645 [Epulopiscium sp. Nele67-Bin004]|nr:MAG: hypothetical protein ATN35_02645 [Epulopiscium sp. Nele67-Bin004]
MPLPILAWATGAVASKILLGTAVAAGTAGAVAGVKGAIDNSDAKDIQSEAESIINKAQKKIETQKDATTKNIETLGKTKINIWGNEFAEFVEHYSKIKNIDLKDSAGLDELHKLGFTQQELSEMKAISCEALNLVSGGLAGLGAGGLLAWGTYSGVMALGTASTGTAIAGLSGAAATNATLAWLGGGSLAAGGGGMAAGASVLGGLVAGPALLIAGGIFAATASENLENAKSNRAKVKKASAEIDLACVELNNIEVRTKQINSLLEVLNKKFSVSVAELKELTSFETDWKLYDKDEKDLVFAIVKLAQIIKAILDTPILDEAGKLTKESEQVLSKEYVL